MTFKEKLEVTRVVIAVLLLTVCVFLVFDNKDGWGWFMFCGMFLYPQQINLDFRERES